MENLKMKDLEFIERVIFIIDTIKSERERIPSNIMSLFESNDIDSAWVEALNRIGNATTKP